MPIEMQQKLLKVLEEKVYYRLGSEKLQQTDFRLISATCDDLVQKTKDGMFRLDLYHRIHSLPLTIPPLRRRREDIPLLIKYYMNRNPRKIHITTKAMKALERYDWPGNVRELNNLMSKRLNSRKRKTGLEDLPEDIVNNIRVEDTSKTRLFSDEHYAYLKEHGFRKYINTLEKEIFEFVTRKFDGKIMKIVDFLKIHYSSYHLRNRTQENHEKTNKNT